MSLKQGEIKFKPWIQLNHNIYCKHPEIRTYWIENLLAEICSFNAQNYKNQLSQARSSWFLYLGYSKIMMNNSTKVL